MDRPEFQEVVEKFKHILDQYGNTEKYFFQLMTHDGVISNQTAVTNMNEHDPVKIAKAFSRTSELLLVQFREWLTK